MVENGWALAYKQYSKKFIQEEENAKNNKLGIWKGEFIKPWKWRKGVRLISETMSSNTDCLIKGNISSSGERIYHVPGGQYYNKTKITISKGEKWFCSENDALASGWRRSMR